MGLQHFVNFLIGIRGPRTELEWLEFEGFEAIRDVSFPEDELTCTVYARGNERAIYSQQQSKIISRYIQQGKQKVYQPTLHLLKQ